MKSWKKICLWTATGLVLTGILVAVLIYTQVILPRRAIQAACENPPEASDPAPNAATGDARPSRMITTYQSLSQLTEETKKLIKSGLLEEAEGRILEELPAASKSWLGDDFNSLMSSQAQSLQAAILEDPRLLPILLKHIQSLNQQEATSAAMLDIVGAKEQARNIYASILKSDLHPPIAIRLHLIRLLGPVEPDKLPGLLIGAPDSQMTQSALTSALYAAETFDVCIAIINAISEHLEQVEVQPGDRFEWVSGLGGEGFVAQVYGSHQLPPIWEPTRPHDNGMIGTPSNAAMVEVRRKAYERLYKASLRLPHQAAWGFSRLGALADLRGEFENNPELAELARKALRTSGKPTPLGFFVTEAESPRFFSPELYLAYARWKGEKDDTKFTPSIDAQIKRLEMLFAADPADFVANSKALLQDSTLTEDRYHDGINPIQESAATIASRRFRDILQIWHERGNDVDILDLILDLAENEKGVSNSYQVGGILVDYMLTIADEKKPARVADILERLATIYLGPRSERAKAMKSLPPLGVICDYVSSQPTAVQYVAMLRLMVEKPALIFPALEKADELGIMERMMILNWIHAGHFRIMPARVIARLDLSPMLAGIKQFRVFPRESGLMFFSNHPQEPTLLDWVAVEIGKLDAASKKPFLDYLEAKQTFGAMVILATLKNDADQALAAIFKAHSAEIAALPDARKMELAAFAVPRLPKNAAELLSMLAPALHDENKVRLQKFEATLLKEADAPRDKPGNSPGELFMQIYQNDPDLAIKALHLAMDAQEAGRAEVPLFPQEQANLDNTVVSSLLERIPDGTDLGRKSTEFYLRVLADERLNPQIIVNQRLLTPGFSEGGTADREMDQLKNALVWISEIYPKNLAKEYFLIAAIERWGWISSQGEEAAQTPQFRHEVVAALPVPFRNITNSGLLLGSHSHNWLFRSPKTPDWNDADVASAFDTASGIIANENLPLNLRLAVASAICRNCGIHTSPALGRQCAKLLASAWSANVPVGTTQEDDILQVFSYQDTDESYHEVARSLTAAWGKHVSKMDHDGGGEARISSDAAVWIAGLMAVLNDDASLQKATTGRYKDLFQSRAIKLLPLLVRAGKVDEAARLVKHSTKVLSVRTWSDPRTYFDLALQRHLPALLANIDDPEERILAETHLNGLQSWPFAPVLPSRETRLTAVAKRALDVKFQRPEIRRAVYQLLAQEAATSGLLADGFIEAAELDRLDEIMKSSERYAWVHLSEVMMCCVLRAGKFERAIGILQQINEKSKSGAKEYVPVWEALSKGISSAVGTYQNDPEMLAQMLPITRFIAALPPDHGLPDRDLAENYARNIFCHAQLNRMGDWKTWRNSLAPVVRKNLDAIWYPRSGWIIGMTTARTSKDTSLEERLAMMKRILSHPEIVGPSGEIRDDAIGHLRRSAYFSPPELLKIGTELAEVIPDGGKASKAVEKLKEEAGSNK